MHFNTGRIRKKKRFSGTSVFLILSLFLQLLFPLSLPSVALAGEKWETFFDDGSYWINALAREGDYLWIGTKSNGVLKWNLTTKTYEKYTTVNSDLPSNTISSIAIDSGGNKWFGTNSGVCKFSGTDWEIYTTADGLAGNNVFSIGIDSAGNKWFGTIGGVSKLDTGGNWETYDTSDGLVHPFVSCIAFDSAGNKWFGTIGGVSKLDTDGNWETFDESDGLADDIVYSVAVDSTGDIWFGTQEGVSKFNGTNWTTYDTSNSDLTHNTVYSIAIDSAKNKWFATHHNGVSKFDDTNWTTYNTYNSDLPYNRVHSVIVDSANDKWFGTQEGIGKLDTSPEVVSTNPSDSATGVSVSSNISVTFSDKMDTPTIDELTFLLRDNEDNPVPGDVTYDSSTRTATFDPDSNLSYSTTYTATVTTEVQDIGDNNMASEEAWSFTTEAPPPSPALSSPSPASAPCGSTTWYFAEGCTLEGFDTWLTLQNPGGTDATVAITYYDREGATITKNVTIPANSRETTEVNLDVGQDKEVSIKVESDQPIVAERPMYFNFNGIAGGHNTIGCGI